MRERRRVQGLRQEELAQLAGVSPDYYARLEQGWQQTASAAVLDALARALRLNEDERSYFHNLEQVRQVAKRGSTTPPLLHGNGFHP